MSTESHGVPFTVNGIPLDCPSAYLDVYARMPRHRCPKCGEICVSRHALHNHLTRRRNAEGDEVHQGFKLKATVDTEIVEERESPAASPQVCKKRKVRTRHETSRVSAAANLNSPLIRGGSLSGCSREQSVPPAARPCNNTESHTYWIYQRPSNSDLACFARPDRLATQCFG